MNDYASEFVCVHACVLAFHTKIGHPQWRLYIVNTVEVSCSWLFSVEVALFPYWLVAHGSPKFCQRCPLRKRKKEEKKKKEMFFGPVDLLLNFNWVVKSNPELFQECQNVIPWFVYRRSTAVKDTER